MSHHEREPGKYLPLLNMVKSMLYSLPKEERRVLYLRYCLHKEVNYIADKLYRERTTIYRMEKRALQKLMQHQRNDCL
jgi:DNA-directed RNA polymerase specialized sigma subunit